MIHTDQKLARNEQKHPDDQASKQGREWLYFGHEKRLQIMAKVIPCVNGK
jgi:hypothetical protein